jgi:prefoldin subunit 5
MLQLVDLWLGTRGADAEQLAKRAGLDFERQIAPLLSGEIGLTLTAAGAARHDLASLRANMEVGLALGLQAPERMGELLSEIAARPDLDATVDRTAPVPRLQFPWPDFKPLRVGLAGRSLLATTDAALFARVARRTDERSFVAALANPALRELLSDRGSPAAVIVDGALVPGLLASGVEPRGPRVAIASAEPVEQTPELAELAERIARLDAEIATLHTRQRAEETERMVALGRELGTFAVLARADEDALVAFGGLFPREVGLRSALSALVRRKRKNDVRAEASTRALNELVERRNELEKKRSRIHSRDPGISGDAAGHDEPIRLPRSAED